MWFLEMMSLIYWVENIKIDTELVLPKYSILSSSEGTINHW